MEVTRDEIFFLFCAGAVIVFTFMSALCAPGYP